MDNMEYCFKRETRPGIRFIVLVCLEPFLPFSSYYIFTSKCAPNKSITRSETEIPGDLIFVQILPGNEGIHFFFWHQFDISSKVDCTLQDYMEKSRREENI